MSCNPRSSASVRVRVLGWVVLARRCAALEQELDVFRVRLDDSLRQCGVIRLRIALVNVGSVFEKQRGEIQQVLHLRQIRIL